MIQFTITACSIDINYETTSTVAAVRSNCVLTNLSALMSSLSTLINVYSVLKYQQLLQLVHSDYHCMFVHCHLV